MLHFTTHTYRQCGKSFSGTNPLYRVLHYTKVDLALDFEEVNTIMERFGPVQRTRPKLTKDVRILNHYVVFGNSKFAHDAHMQLDGNCQRAYYKNKVV